MHPMLRNSPKLGHPHLEGQVRGSRHMDSGTDGGMWISWEFKDVTYCLQNIMKWGNGRANTYWEAHLKPGHIPADQYAGTLTERDIITNQLSAARSNRSFDRSTSHDDGQWKGHLQPTHLCSTEMALRLPVPPPPRPYLRHLPVPMST
jgi:hypothetical protein